MKAVGWTVFLNDREIDIVFFDEDMNEWDVKHALVNHDGYPPNVEVERSKKWVR